MSEPEHVTLAREAQTAGLVVTHLMPAAFRPALPDGTPWAEGRDESAPMIRAYVSHYTAHQQALTQPGLRLVIPGDGTALTCGCLTNDTTEEGT